MTAAAWASSSLQNTWFRRSCSHSKPQRVPSTSKYPSWCSQHKAASITGLILVLHTPLTVENKQWCVRAPRNPENSRDDEKARWDGSKEKQKIWSCFVRMEWEIKPGEFWVSPVWTGTAVCTFSGLTWFNKSYLLPQHWGGWRGNIWDQTNEFWLWDVGKRACPEKSSPSWLLQLKRLRLKDDRIYTAKNKHSSSDISCRN